MSRGRAENKSINVRRESDWNVATDPETGRCTAGPDGIEWILGIIVGDDPPAPQQREQRAHADHQMAMRW